MTHKTELEMGRTLQTLLQTISFNVNTTCVACSTLGCIVTYHQVAGVVGRADVLACLFFLSSVLLYHGSPGRQFVWRSALLAALSMLAKETGLMAVVFNVTLDVYKSWNPTRLSQAVKWRWKADGLSGRVVKSLFALVVLAGVRLALLQGSLPTFSPQDNPAAFHPSFLLRLMTFWYLAALNWWLMVCPWSLSHDWQMGSVPLITSAVDARNLLTCAAVIATVALLYRCWSDLELQRHTAMVVGLLLLALPFLPASNMFVTVGFVLAERVLYMPSVGFVILVSHGVQLLWSRCRSPSLKRALAVCACVYVASHVARTQLRTSDWSSRETLLRADLKVLPHNAKLHYNYANYLKDVDQPENAIKHYKEALRLWPSYASAHNNLGTLVWARAEHHFLQALRYNNLHLNAHYNLAKLYRKKNRLAESLRMLERCITLEPKFVHAYLELLLIKKDKDKRWILDKLLDLEPNNWEHYVLYGHWFKDRGLHPLSLEYYTTAMRLSLRERTHRRTASVSALRSTCLLLRDMGQRSRMLQYVTRWQSWWGTGAGAVRRALAARAWRLRTELEGRAALYSRTHLTHTTSTCLHHSHLEVSAASYPDKATHNEMMYSTHTNAPSRDDGTSQSNTRLENNNCQKVEQSNTKKSVSLSHQYKPIHNKSDTGVKQKSCSLHKNKKIDEEKQFTPFVSDHLIKTY